MTDGPLIVQSDKTVLLEVDHEQAGARAPQPFAELERAPEHIHTYRITPLALWNARAAGHDAEQVVDALVSFSRYAVPQPLLVDIVDVMARYGRLQLVKHLAHGLTLVSLDRAVLEEVLRNKKIAPMLGPASTTTPVVHNSERGRVKQMLLKIGWPAEDLAGYVDGEEASDQPAPGQLAPARLPGDGRRLVLGGRLGCRGAAVRRGQDAGRRGGDGQGRRDDADPGHQHRGGRQWKRELINRTSLTEDEIGEYSGEKKEIRPVTIATYQVITRRTKGEYRHLELFDSRDWGLIIYDEVHLLPAPVFRMTADLQSGGGWADRDADPRGRPRGRRVQPDRAEALRRAVEGHRGPGLDRTAECIEVRVTMTDNERMLYAVAGPDERYRLCSTVHSKIAVVKSILETSSRRPDAGDRRLPGPARRARRGAGTLR